jgi:hypothetical protein
VITEGTVHYQSENISIQYVETETDQDAKRERFSDFLKTAAGSLLSYLFFFLCFRFDIRRHGTSFQHPMATGKAALVAIPFAVATAVLIIIKSQQNPVGGGSYLTSLSLHDSDDSTKERRATDIDKPFQ